eukprot:766798-Hanusia_phi.AAC.2
MMMMMMLTLDNEDDNGDDVGMMMLKLSSDLSEKITESARARRDASLRFRSSCSNSLVPHECFRSVVED